MARGGRGKTGGTGGNTVTGTNGNDILDGLGPSFVLIGGKGDDVYYIDDAGDEVVEKNNGGADRVFSLINYSLGDYVENLTLVGGSNLSGTGNDLDNDLVGNDGDNTLFGLGGDDTITGGGGSDLIDGGLGTDTAVFEGVSTDYTFQWDGPDLLIVSTTTGTTDILRNVEFLRFQNGLIAISDIDNGPGDLPRAVDDTDATAEDSASVIAVLSNDIGQGLSVASATNGAKGLVTINSDGTVTYTPNDNAFGTDSFTYTIRDAAGQESTATVSVSIASVNDAPVATADNYAAVAGEVYTSTTSVLSNDTDVDGDPLVVIGVGWDFSLDVELGATSYQSATSAGGTVTISSTGTFTYAPPAGFTGTDSFTYAVGDGHGGDAIATVSLTFGPAPPDPGGTPYYVEALLLPSPWHRLNYPDDVGTAVTVSFAFAEVTPEYYSADSFAWDNFQAFSAEQRLATIGALDGIASFSGLNFVETSVDQAEIVFGIADSGFSGLAFAPSGDGVGSTASDVWIDDGWAQFGFEPGTQAYKTLIHEIGHAIGMSHPSLSPDEDTRQFTVMSAYHHPTMDGEPQTHMLFDIATLQYLYGANTTFASGNDTYLFAALDGVVKTIWDSGGHDLIDMSGATYGVRIDLREGAFSTIAASGTDNIAIAFGAVIEDAIGGAHDDVLIGNEAANRLIGGGGNDVLTGRGGADVFGFGANWGNDIVTDFEVGLDMLDYSAAGLSFADLKITYSSGDTLISQGTDSVLLQGVASIDESSFLIA